MPTTASASTMRAVVQDGYGDADVLRPGRVAQPTAADREVLVRVHAAGLNRGTWHLMTGTPYAVRLAFGLRRPRQPVIGNELAGTIVSVGRHVTRFARGDEVYGIGSGTFAEYAVAREDKLARKPANLTFEQAAIVPVSATTALQSLTDLGHLEAGQRVLVTGASGGVGTFAVQIAKALGAHVTAECSTGKVDLVRSLGADEVLDYTVDDFAVVSPGVETVAGATSSASGRTGTGRYDLILDLAGNPSVTRLRRALTPTGTTVLAGGEHGGKVTGMSRQLRALLLSPFVKQRLTLCVSRERAADLERLTALIEDGSVTPALDSTYPLDQSADAMRRLVAGDVRGKLAVTVGTG